MNPKTARRFLSRNAWKITTGRMGFSASPPSFWERVRDAYTALELEAYNALSGEERICRMFNY